MHYVEAHARTPSMLMTGASSDGTAEAAAFLDRTFRAHDLGDPWAFHALHSDGRVNGKSEAELGRLYRDAAVRVNLHRGTVPRPEHYASGRLAYPETDPVEVQIDLAREDRQTIEYREPHCAFCTFGERYALGTSRVAVVERVCVAAAPPARRLRPVAPPPPAQTDVHDRGELAAAVAARHVRRPHVLVEQGAAVPALPRRSCADRPLLRAGARCIRHPSDASNLGVERAPETGTNHRRCRRARNPRPTWRNPSSSRARHPARVRGWICTDSGGVQEETTVLGMPCLTLRDNTERPITVSEGTNRVVGRSPERILAGVRDVLVNGVVAQRPVLWDRRAGERVGDALMGNRDGRPPRPTDLTP